MQPAPALGGMRFFKPGVQRIINVVVIGTVVEGLDADRHPVARSGANASYARVTADVAAIGVVAALVRVYERRLLTRGLGPMPPDSSAPLGNTPHSSGSSTSRSMTEGSTGRRVDRSPSSPVRSRRARR